MPVALGRSPTSYRASLARSQMSAASFDIAIVGGGMVGASLATALRAAGVARSPHRVCAAAGGHTAQLRRSHYGTFQWQPADSRQHGNLGGAGARCGCDPAHPCFRPGPLRIRAHRRSRGGRCSAGLRCGQPDHRHCSVARAAGNSQRADVVPGECRTHRGRRNGGQVACQYTAWKTSSCRRACWLLRTARSPSIRKHAGIEVTSWDYDQSAIITNVATQRFHDHVAYERFTPTGPLAILPLVDGRCTVVWTLVSRTRTDYAAARR